MWQLCHVSRVEKRGGPEASPADCWLESWRNEAVDAGARALDRLRDGVEEALKALGSGFLRHPANEPLRSALQDGRLTKDQYHRALLRLVYRLLFCFVAEDRDALLNPSAGTQERERYARFFSTARLRRLSRVRAGGTHGDLWRAQRLVLSALGNHGHRGLGLPGLAGLFDPDPALPVIDGTTHPDLLLGCSLTNNDLLKAVRHLAWLRVPGRPVQPVDYRHLGTEELGSVYESLLELLPQVDLADRSFRLAERDRAASARPRAPTTPRQAWYPPFSTRPWTRCSTTRSRTPPTGPTPNGGCSRSPSAIPLVAPGTSWSPPPAASPSDWPSSAPAKTSPPRRKSSTPCGRSSAVASTASTSTTWPPNWPRYPCGWRHWSPASRSASSTPVSGSATPCSGPPQPCYGQASPMLRSRNWKETTSSMPQGPQAKQVRSQRAGRAGLRGRLQRTARGGARPGAVHRRRRRRSPRPGSAVERIRDVARTTSLARSTPTRGAPRSCGHCTPAHRNRLPTESFMRSQTTPPTRTLRRPSKKPNGCGPTTASSIGMWSSPRSSRWMAVKQVLRDRKGGLVASPA